MNDRSTASCRADLTVIELPRWVQSRMALAGAALLIGPTLAVLWPR